eukprot:366230-Chlamydomonas_euryale.AAC.27
MLYRHQARHTGIKHVVPASSTSLIGLTAFERRRRPDRPAHTTACTLPRWKGDATLHPHTTNPPRARDGRPSRPAHTSAARPPSPTLPHLRAGDGRHAVDDLDALLQLVQLLGAHEVGLGSGADGKCGREEWGAGVRRMCHDPFKRR